MSVRYIDINAISYSLDLNIFRQDECFCSKFILEVEYPKSNLKTPLSHILMICHLLPFVRVGQYMPYYHLAGDDASDEPTLSDCFHRPESCSAAAHLERTMSALCTRWAPRPSLPSRRTLAPRLGNGSGRMVLGGEYVATGPLDLCVEWYISW